MAFLVIALLLGIATISSKAKSKPMYVRATLMILATVMTCNYIGTFSKTKKGVKPLGFHTFYYLLINYYFTSSKSAS